MNKYLLMIVFLLSFWVPEHAEVGGLNGLPTDQILLVPGVVSLSFNSPLPIIKPNGQELHSSWIGYGWDFSLPYISVMHNFTVTCDDDMWYYNDPKTGSGEILRTFVANTEKFYLKNNPYTKVYPIYETGTSQPRIIGWEMISPDGIKSKFGNVDGSSDASRYIPYWGEKIGGLPSGTPPTGHYIYQWDLKETQNTFGKKITYTYQNFLRNIGSHPYVGESYLQKIETFLGEKIIFTLDPLPKSINEGSLEMCDNTQFDFSEMRFLRSISLKNQESDTLEQITFAYTGDPGESNHIFYDKRGFSKRLLTKIHSSLNNGSKYSIAYNTTDVTIKGYLESISQPGIGKSYTYEYANKTLPIDLVNQISLELPSTNYDNCKFFYIGNHVFIIDETTVGGNLSAKIEVISKVRTSWQKSALDGVTGITHQDKSFFPSANQFIILTKNKDGGGVITGHTLELYEFIDDEWKKTFTRIFTGIINEVEIHQYGGYFILFEPNRTILYAFRKIKNEWKSTFNSPSGGIIFPNGIADEYGHETNGEGWNWPEPNILPAGVLQDKRIHIGPNYFIYSFRQAFGALSTDVKSVAHVFYWNGDKGNDCLKTTNDEWWVNTFVPDSRLTFFNSNSRNYPLNPTVNGFTYKYSDAFDIDNIQSATPANPAGPLFSIYDNHYVVNNPYLTNTNTVFIREFNSENLEWEPKFFNVGEFTKLATFQEMHWNSTARLYSNNNYIIILDNTGFRKMMVYRYINREWIATNISPTGTCSAPAAGIYAKQFSYDINRIYTAENYFIACNEVNDFIWNFRWDQSIGKWESKLNGTGTGGGDGQADSYCQGINLSEKINEISPRNELFGIYSDGTGDQGHIQIYEYDNMNSSYQVHKNEYFPNKSDNKIYLTKNELFVHQKEVNGTQSLRINNKFKNQWDGNPTIATVKSLSVNGGVSTAPAIVTKYSYTTAGFDNIRGIPFFRKVNQFTNNGLYGYTEKVFNTDSISNLYGTVKSITNYKEIKSSVKGTLLDYDDVPRNTGSVQLRRYRTIHDPMPGIGEDEFIRSSTVLLNSDGTFEVKLDNPYGSSFFLDYVEGGGTAHNIMKVSVESGLMEYMKLVGIFRRIVVKEVSDNPIKWDDVMIPFGPKMTLTGIQWVTKWDGTRNESVVNSDVVSKLINKWNSHEVSYPNNRFINIPRLEKTISVTNGVESEINYPLENFNEQNGISYVSWKKNSDGKILIEKKLFAFEENTYKVMGEDYHMLSQLSGTKMFQYKESDFKIKKCIINRTIEISNSDSNNIILPFIDLQSPFITDGDQLRIPIVIRSSFPFSIDRVNFILQLKFSGGGILSFPIGSKNVSFYPLATVLTYKLNNADLEERALNSVTEISLQIRGVDRNLFVMFSGNAPSTIVKNLTSDDNVFAAKATTWQQAHGTWVPFQSYSWNVPMDSEGLPVSSAQYKFKNFDHTEGAINQNWKLQGTVNKYNSNGSSNEIISPSGIKSTIIYGDKHKLPIARVQNASFNGIGIYTCDYDLDVNYGGSENGWDKGGVFTNGIFQINSDKPHFGQKSLHIKNSYGPTKNITQVDITKNYVFSAWVYPMISNKMRMVVEPRINGNSPVPGSNFDTEATGLIVNKWNYISKTITSKELQDKNIDGKDGDYLRIWIGNYPTDVNKADFYVDDIRFYPNDAFVTTTYYDTLWKKTILNVSSNNNPSPSTKYDEIGRLHEIWKKGKLVQRTEYHLTEEWFPNEYFRFLKPNNGDVLNRNLLGRITDITWETNPTKIVSDVKIQFTSDQGNWTIQTSTNNDGFFPWYDVTIKPPFSNCKIKISDVNDSSHFIECGYFTINP